MSSRIVPSLTLALASLAGSANAAIIQWNVNGPTSDWTNPANWVGGHVPGANDIVIIPAGGSAMMTTDVNIYGLEVFTGGSLVVLGQLTVNWGLMQENARMSIAGDRAALVHAADFNCAGVVTMWSGAVIARTSASSNSFILDPRGTIDVPSYDVGGVTIGTALYVNGLFRHESNQDLRIGRTIGDRHDGSFIVVGQYAGMEFDKSCAVKPTNWPGQVDPYIVNSGTLTASGSLSDVVDLSAGVTLLNEGTVRVERPDLHIRGSWDIGAGGALVRGTWECAGYGRIFMDNNVVNSIGPSATITLWDAGSQFVPAQQASENDGYISVRRGAGISFNPSSEVFTNHGYLELGEHSLAHIGGLFYNDSNGRLATYITGGGGAPYAIGSVVAAQAALAGHLAVTYNGARPEYADTFPIVYGSQSLWGQFAAVDMTYFAVPLDAVYDANTASLVAGCAADFNRDGSVDFFDYDDFVACFEGEVCPPSKSADFNGDLAVDFFDYDEFVAAFEVGC